MPGSFQCVAFLSLFRPQKVQWCEWAALKQLRGNAWRKVCALNERLHVNQERNVEDDGTVTRWDACGETIKAVLALLKAAEPNAASTNALVGFLTAIIAR